MNVVSVISGYASSQPILRTRPDLSITLHRTSVTVDEAVGILMGWIDGPVDFQPSSEYPTEDELEMLDDVMFSVSDELEQQRDFLENEWAQAKLDHCSAEVIAAKKLALDQYDHVIHRAQGYLCAVQDEINKGDRSALRVDTARTLARCTYVTLASFDEWASERYGVSILEESPSTVVTTASHQKPSKPPKTRLLQQEQAILAALVSLGHDPKLLPDRPRGAEGPKSDVRGLLDGNALFKGTTVFDNAWERLRQSGDLKGGK